MEERWGPSLGVCTIYMGKPEIQDGKASDITLSAAPKGVYLRKS